MFVPRDANLNELVVAERAVATECKNECANYIYNNKVIVQTTTLLIVRLDGSLLPYFCFKLMMVDDYYECFKLP